MEAPIPDYLAKPMKVTRVHLKGWTASFRYPMFIAGYQPTLAVPPLSTVFGLLSAAVGRLVTTKDTRFAYLFKSSGKSVDLETIYELAPNLKAKSNVIKREFLYEPEMYLYIENEQVADSFRQPYYPLLLGRSSDLLEVKEIKQVEVKKTQGEVYFGRTIVPFPEMGLRGSVQALPTYFTEDIPRKAVKTRLYAILDSLEKIRADGLTWLDEEYQWGLYFHGESENRPG